MHLSAYIQRIIEQREPYSRQNTACHGLSSSNDLHQLIRCGSRLNMYWQSSSKISRSQWFNYHSVYITFGEMTKIHFVGNDMKYVITSRIIRITGPVQIRDNCENTRRSRIERDWCATSRGRKLRAVLAKWGHLKYFSYIFRSFHTPCGRRGRCLHNNG